jgi:hypothetical protein
MAIKTYYLSDTIADNWGTLAETPQTAINANGGWTVGMGATNHSAFESGVKRLESTFVDTAPPDGSLDPPMGDAWRAPGPLTGSFAAGNWSFQFAIRAQANASGQDGRVRFRILKADADGSNGTEITAAQQQASIVTNVATASDMNSTLTVNPGAFSITNQYLFIQIAWERTGGGSSSTADIKFRTGSAATPTGTVITTADFSNTGEIVGTLTQTLAAATLSATGTVSGAGSTVTGTLAKTLGALVCTASGTSGAVISPEIERLGHSPLGMRLSLELDGEGNGWTDVTRDVRTQVPVECERGIAGSSPLDRVAATGTLRFALNNLASATGLEGRWSPNHVNATPGFDFGIGVKWELAQLGPDIPIINSTTGGFDPLGFDPTGFDTGGGFTTSIPHGFFSGDRIVISGHVGSTPNVNGAQTVAVFSPTVFGLTSIGLTSGGTGGIATRNTVYERFRGRLEDIDPEPGANFARRVFCTAVDWMDEAARALLRGVVTQVNRRSDQVFETVVAAMPVQPVAWEISEGLDTFPYAVDSARDEGMTALSEFQRIATSELGYIFIKGDGTLVFESRRKRGLATTNVQTFVDQNLTSLEVRRSRSMLINRVTAVAHPRRVDPNAQSVLYTLRNPSPVGPSEQTVIFGPYRDPAQLAARVGGVDMQPLVPFVDYQMNALPDGTGADLTTSFLVTVEAGGNGVYFTILNAGSQTGHVTKLQIRGRGLYDFENAIAEAEDADLVPKYGQNTISFDMPYQADPLVAGAAARYILGLYKDPLTGVERLTFNANLDETLLQAALVREISDRIGVVESISGLTTTLPNTTSTRGFFINGMALTLSHGFWLTCALTLSPADQNQYWILAQPGASEVSLTTRPGFGIFQGHIDVAHLDFVHQDIAHSDVAHGDAVHGDAGHADSGHADVLHTDVAHNDRAHSDMAHADVAHVDSTTHTDQAHIDGSNHADHQDHVHADVSPHGDQAHQDVSQHNDTIHQDTAHADLVHNDAPHQDVAHQDAAHGDAGHADSAHSDGVHTDTPHADEPHGDTEHGDAIV